MPMAICLSVCHNPVFYSKLLNYHHANNGTSGLQSFLYCPCAWYYVTRFSVRHLYETDWQSVLADQILVTSPEGAVAKYCDQYVCVCVCVCVPVREDISGTAEPN